MPFFNKLYLENLVENKSRNSSPDNVQLKTHKIVGIRTCKFSNA